MVVCGQTAATESSVTRCVTLEYCRLCTECIVTRPHKTDTATERDEPERLAHVGRPSGSHDNAPIISAKGVSFSYRKEHGVLSAIENLQWSAQRGKITRSEEHTSELQSLRHLVCRL